MTTAENLYKAGTFEAQAAYYRWLATHLDPGRFVDILNEMATLRENWAQQLRTGRLA